MPVAQRYVWLSSDELDDEETLVDCPECRACKLCKGSHAVTSDTFHDWRKANAH